MGSNTPGSALSITENADHRANESIRTIDDQWAQRVTPHKGWPT
ncbi:hypothetical protein ABIE66_001345 [Peribacillus sp. B2I2]